MTWPKRGKFGNKKQELDGYSFSSKLEAALYLRLKVRESAGEIKDIKCQETIYLTDARIIYKPDFSFFYILGGKKRYAESKGFETPEWRIKRRLWMHYGPEKMEIWMGSHTNIFLKETIGP